MDVLEPVKKWLLGKALEKFGKRALTVIIAGLTTHVASPEMAQLGISMQGDIISIGLVAFLTGLLSMVLNFIKIKFPAAAPFL